MCFYEHQDDNDRWIEQGAREIHCKLKWEAKNWFEDQDKKKPYHHTRPLLLLMVFNFSKTWWRPPFYASISTLLKCFIFTTCVISSHPDVPSIRPCVLNQRDRIPCRHQTLLRTLPWVSLPLYLLLLLLLVQMQPLQQQRLQDLPGRLWPVQLPWTQCL